MDPLIADCRDLGAKVRDQHPMSIVVHCMAEFLDLDPIDQPALEFLRSQRLSAHILVQPSGTLVRMLDERSMGAHAKGHNDGSLGIEILVPGVHTWGSFLEAIREPWVSAPQYFSAVWMVREWMRNHAIRLEQVERHSDLSPGRKFDPGDGFPWFQFLEDVGNGQTDR